MNTEETYHFKAGFDPKCPKVDCGSTDIQVSLSEDLRGPVNGQYEVIYCGKCHTFLGAHPAIEKDELPQQHGMLLPKR